MEATKEAREYNCVTAADLRWCPQLMKPLSKDELFENLSGFLKTKGIKLTDGAYSHGIQKSCSILADVINLGQQGLQKAKVGLDQKVDQMRQVIHEKTAPKPPPMPPAAAAATAAPPPKSARPRAAKTVRKAKPRRRK